MMEDSKQPKADKAAKDNDGVEQQQHEKDKDYLAVAVEAPPEEDAKDTKPAASTMTTTTTTTAVVVASLEDVKPAAVTATDTANDTATDIDMDDDRQHQAGLLQRKWDEMFDRLKVFKEKHGHCLVPNRYPEDTQLGSWVSTQRRQYKVMKEDGNESTPMTDERAKRLEQIGFKWSTKDPRHVPWQKRYEELSDFKGKYGHSQVPIGWEENIQLSNWVSTQRQEYKLLQKGRSSRLTQDRISLLNKVDFVWEAQRGGPRRKRKATVAVPPKANPVEGIGPHAKRGTFAGMSGISMMGGGGGVSNGMPFMTMMPSGATGAGPWNLMPHGGFQAPPAAAAASPAGVPPGSAAPHMHPSVYFPMAAAAAAQSQWMAAMAQFGGMPASMGAPRATTTEDATSPSQATTGITTSSPAAAATAPVGTTGAETSPADAFTVKATGADTKTSPQENKDAPAAESDVMEDLPIPPGVEEPAMPAADSAILPPAAGQEGILGEDMEIEMPVDNKDPAPDADL